MSLKKIEQGIQIANRVLNAAEQIVRIYDRALAVGGAVRQRYQEAVGAVPNAPRRQPKRAGRRPQRAVSDSSDDDAPPASRRGLPAANPKAASSSQPRHQPRAPQTKKHVEEEAETFSDQEDVDLPDELRHVRDADNFKLEKDEEQMRMQEIVLQQTMERLKSALEAKDEDLVLFYSQQWEREFYRVGANLPALLGRQSIIQALQGDHQFILVRGETGSGKSTQLPQYLADLEEFRTKTIICTQPRSLAASALADRVGTEWSYNDPSLPELKNQVIHQKDHKLSTTARIQFFNESLLVSLLADEKESTNCKPENIGAIIIDEAHERSINTDLLIGILRTDPKWSHTKVIITSASMDVTPFLQFLPPSCPFIEIPGKTYPVKVSWKPSSESLRPDLIVEEAIKATLEVLKRHPDEGDILVFLTAQGEIESACERLLDRLEPDVQDQILCLPLYGKQLPEDQKKAIDPAPPGMRKVIFSTDVAETSLTINGLKIVIDMGLCKTALYDPIKNVTSLCVVPISKSSAQQRKGRVGRTSMGYCYRYYSEDDHLEWAEGKEPEILRKPLDITIASLLQLNIHNPAEFAWIDPPKPENVKRSLERLELFGAISSISQLLALPAAQSSRTLLTRVGKLVVTLQMDPGQAAMVYYAASQGYGTCGAQLAAISELGSSALWSDRESRDLAREKHVSLRVEGGGDLVSFYHIFQKWNQISKRDRKQATRWSVTHYINNKMMNQVLSKSMEVVKVLKKAGFWAQGDREAKKVEPTTELLLKLSLRMLLPNIGFNIYKKQYHVLSGVLKDADAIETLVGDIHRDSLVFDLEASPWVLYQTILSTSRTFMIQVTPFKIEWIKEINPAHYKRVLDASEKYRVLPLIVTNVSPALQALLLGQNSTRAAQMINELQCLGIESNPETLELKLWTQKARHDHLKAAIEGRLDMLRLTLRNEVVEEPYGPGGVRLAVGAGMTILEILTRPPAEQFTTFELPNLPYGTREDDVRTLVRSVLMQHLPEVDADDAIREVTVHTRDRTGRVVLFPSSVAIRALHYLTQIDRQAIDQAWKKVIARPSMKTAHYYQPPFRSRLIISAHTRNSTQCKGRILYQSAEQANRALDATSFEFNSGAVDPTVRKTRRFIADGTKSKLLGINVNNIPSPERKLRQKLFSLRCPTPDLICIFRDNPTSYDYSHQASSSSTAPSTQNKVALTAEELTIGDRRDPLNVKLTSKVKTLLQSHGLASENVQVRYQRWEKRLVWTIPFQHRVDTLQYGTPAYLVRKAFMEEFETDHPSLKLFTHHVYQELECVLSIPELAFRCKEREFKTIMDDFKRLDLFNTIERRKADPKLDSSETNPITLASPSIEFLACGEKHIHLDNLLRQVAAACNPNHDLQVADTLFLPPGLAHLTTLAERYKCITWDFTRRSVYFWTEDAELIEEMTRTLKNIETTLHKVVSCNRLVETTKLKSVTENLAQNPNYLKDRAQNPAQIECTELRSQYLWIWGHEAEAEMLVERLQEDGLLMPKRLQRKHEEAISRATSPGASSSALIASSSCPLSVNAAPAVPTFECSVCLSDFEISDPNVICLALCCHRFCQDCLVGHLTHYAPGKPLTCPDRDCKELLTHKDLITLGPLLPPPFISRLRDGALNTFLLDHRSTFRRCPKQGCPQLVHIVDFMGALRADCTICHVTYCISCSKDGEAVVHAAGQGCLSWERADGMAVRREVVETLNSKCPRCRAVFFDFAGCFCVECAQCHTHFCAFCLEVHGDSRTIHAHVPQCPQNETRQLYGTLDTFHQLCRARARRSIIDILSRYAVNDQRGAMELFHSVSMDLTTAGVQILFTDFIRAPTMNNAPAAAPSNNARHQAPYQQQQPQQAHNQQRPGPNYRQNPQPNRYAPQNPPPPQNPPANQPSCIIL